VSKQLTSLRDLLQRTSANLPDSLRRVLPRPNQDDQATNYERLPVPRDHEWKPREERDRPGWLSWRLIRRKAVAASLEGSSLRLLSLENGHVVGWSDLPVVERAARGSQINDPVVLGAAVDEAFADLDLTRRNVAWALPGYQSTARVLELPSLRGDELRYAIEEEFERILGASASDFYLSWQRLAGRVRQRYVFVIAIPKATVLGAIEALEAAEIQPRTMDLRPLAIVRALGCADGVVANLEEGSLDIVVVDRSVPAVIRSLPLVGPAAARDGAQNRLVEEIERTLAYYDDSNPDHPLDVDAPLYLTGSMATGIALAERLRAVTRHPIGRLKPLGVYPPEFPIADYLVALGLSLKRS
jgi:Tfp pilus assembly PilM family ATPase